MANESYEDYYNVMNSTVILFSEEGRIIKYAKLNVAKILNGYELFDKLNIIFWEKYWTRLIKVLLWNLSQVFMENVGPRIFYEIFLLYQSKNMLNMKSGKCIINNSICQLKYVSHFLFRKFKSFNLTLYFAMSKMVRRTLKILQYLLQDF